MAPVLTRQNYRQIAFVALEHRMLGGDPFSHHDPPAPSAPVSGRFVPEPERLIDRAIQRFRRKGWISFKHEGGRVVWRWTSAGEIACGELTK
jgi:hypothetical protein